MTGRSLPRMALRTKLLTLARVSLLPQDSPARAFYQARLIRSQALRPWQREFEPKEFEFKINCSILAFAIAAGVWITLLISGAIEPELGRTADARARISWTMLALMLLGFLACGALTFALLSLRFFLEREHQALLAAFDYFQLSNASAQAKAANLAKGPRGGRP